MTTQRITLPIYNLGCGGGGSLMIERALTKTPGVMQAYVNPATEMAYVVYDPTLAKEGQFAAVIDRMGYGPPPVPKDRLVGASQPDKTWHQGRTCVNHQQVKIGGSRSFLRSPTWLILIAFLAIVAFYLVIEHTAHVLGLLPYALLLLCPILHLFMHGGHGGHGGQGDHSGHGNHSEHQAQRSEGDH